MCAGVEASSEGAIRVRVEEVIIECLDGDLTRCDGETRYFVANCGEEPAEVQTVVLVDSTNPGRYVSFGSAHGPVAPRTVWSWTSQYPIQSSIDPKIDVNDESGIPIYQREKPVRVSNPARLAAMAACEACEGKWGIGGLVYRDGCNCKARDAGRACSDGDACEGQCIFDHWEISSPAPRPQCKGRGCAREATGIGRPVGRCSERRLVYSCHQFLDGGIAALPERPVPWGVYRACID